MDLPNSTAVKATEEAKPPAVMALVCLLEELEEVLRRMDAEGLTLAANHVSQGIELIREKVESIQIGDT